MSEQDTQAHPQEANDREVIDHLLGTTVPENQELTDAARLFMRYDGFPGAEHLKTDLAKVIKLWGLERDELNSKCREIWASGWRPGQESRDPIGSGADVEEREA